MQENIIDEHDGEYDDENNFDTSPSEGKIGGEAFNESKGVKLSKDEQLTDYVVKAMEGDKSDLTPLCAQILKPVLYRIMRSVDNPEDAEDITQEVMLVVCQSIKSIRDPKLFRGWLNKVISHQINKFIVRNGKNSQFEDINDYKDLIDEDESFMPQEMVLNKEAFESVMALIATLPKQQQTVVLLRYYEGMTVTEIAKSSGLAKQTVSTQLSRAHKKLKVELERIASSLGVNAAHFLSFGALMTEFLNQDADIFARENAQWMADVFARCEPYIHATGLTGLIGAAGAATAGAGGAAAGEAVATAAVSGAVETGAAGAVGAAGATAAESVALGATATAGGAGAGGAASTAGGTTAGTAVVLTKTATSSSVVMAAVLTVGIAALTVGGWLGLSHLFSQDSGEIDFEPYRIVYEMDIDGVVVVEKRTLGNYSIQVSTPTGILQLSMNDEDAGWFIMHTASNEIIAEGTTVNSFAETMARIQNNGHEGLHTIRIFSMDQYGNDREIYRYITLTP